MQETRRHILEILRERGHATVDEIVDDLQSRRGREITAVTVRHHLNRLQHEGLITEPELRHRSRPGRPQHVYNLTEQAHTVFPNNYAPLLAAMLAQLEAHTTPVSVNVVFEGVADMLAQQACLPDVPWVERLRMAVDYLNELGYDAHLEHCEAGYVLHTRNCPYHDLARQSDILCTMDLRLVSALTGTLPRRIGHISAGDSSCAFLITCNQN